MTKIDQTLNMENVIFRNICLEIMRECNNKGIRVSEKFIAYYVKLLLLDPKWNISLDNENINRIDLQNLVKYALQQLSCELAPSMITLKMQMYFNSSFDNSSVIIFKHRETLKHKLLPLENEILNWSNVEDEELEKLYKKIVYFLTLKYGLGNPTELPVYKEAHTALHSVFDLKDLKDFVNIPQQLNKQDQLDELSYLLAGVRLFNRDCNKGGQGIEDIPILFTQALEITNNDLEKTLDYVMENVNMVTTALDNCFESVTKGARTVLNIVLPASVTPKDITHAKDLLVCYRQCEIYIRKVLVETEKLEDKSQSIFDEFQWCLIDVHRCVQYKTAVPADAVYPLFNKLAVVWHNMQDMVIYLSKLNQILATLLVYTKQLDNIDPLLKLLIGESPIMTDIQRLQINEDLLKGSKNQMRPLQKPSEIENFDDKPLQYLGFCAWKFVESQGALIPGNPNYGLVEIEGRCYVFSSPRAGQAFLRTPKRFIYEALDIVRRKPELTHFLELYDQLEAVKDIEQLVTKTMDIIITHEVEVQTDLHPETSKKDFNYMWNVWDLKRKALSMANISKCKTHATQTMQSNNRNSIKTQTHETKDHCYQTKKDNYSNVPTLSNYMFGLRGRKDNKQFIITLTRPVDE